mmetsp:Transcript_18621/g.59290  ORF Transcript_18621/g.59290 Transcript_18621/m.59290 type:complete len:315 (-) Transcript_18621:326-1270(-)
MGAFLDKPIEDKESHSGEGNGLKYGLSAMQGWRVDMEDAHTCVTDIPDKPGYSFFGVFDGHGGKMASNMSALHLLGKIRASPKFASSSTDDMSAAMVQGFLTLDESIRATESVRTGEDHSGTTAIVSLITPDYLLVGNCGDSRAVLSRGGKAIPMSTDHKPHLPSERNRIMNAGGTVAMGRVNGDLAVSRALGDFSYKVTPTQPPEKQMVSPEPEVKVVKREQDDEFLILACDGIWDVLSNEQCVDFVRDKLRRYNKVEKVCESLLDECLARGSRDNMSAVLVLFPGAPQPEPKLVEEQAKKDEEEKKRKDSGR